MLGHVPHNLPAPRTSLIGRERDISETRDLVLRGPERLVTLTGVGGSGKTRLALQVATELLDAFPDGVWLVELASISDPLLVPETVASALGFPEASSDTILSTPVSSLSSRTLLIVLDNCEHLIDACAAMADNLLSACSNLRILATSREPLQIAGERQRRVLPLSLPSSGQILSLEELSRCPSVELFVERAAAVEASFRLTVENAASVARICTLLDGIPLAIELAAARVRVLSVDQIVQRLDDCFRLLTGNSRSAPTRQQTLKATLDWSYNLLSEHEQLALRRLSVFAGSWVLEGAAAVCAVDELEGEGVLDLVTRLVDKSLVLVEEQGVEMRYRLLEPVRQYGMRLLDASGELETIRERLASFYVALAEQAEPELYGPAQLEWLRRIEGELDGIRSVVRWSEKRGDAEIVLRLAGALHWYFWIRRHLREGQRWLEVALARAASVPPKVRAKALMAAAVQCSFLGDYPKGSRYGQAALALYRQLGDVSGISMSAITLSHINLGLGDLPTARSLAEESEALARQSGLQWLNGQALIILGDLAHRQGDTSLAVSLHEQAIALLRENEDGWGIRFAMTNLASLQQNQPDIIRATAISSVQHYWEQRDPLSLVAALEYLAGRGETGHPDSQVRLFAAAHSFRKTLGALSSPGERDDIERHLEEARDRLGEAGFAAAWEEGSAMSLEQVVASVLNGGLVSPAPRSPNSPSRAPGPSDALTRRELDVAKLVALGYTDRQIADELTITEGTAGNHVHHILEKLGLRSRVQVVDWALAHGLIAKQPE